MLSFSVAVEVFAGGSAASPTAAECEERSRKDYAFIGGGAREDWGSERKTVIERERVRCWLGREATFSWAALGRGLPGQEFSLARSGC
jgi:hypothetical protein